MYSQNSFHRAFVLSFIIAAAILSAAPTEAVTYTVIPHMVGAVDGSERALLQGTLEIPLGDYIITNGGPSPFSNVNLILTEFGVSFAPLTQVDTSQISGTGAFLIHATPSALIFDTANADAANPAFLDFLSYPPVFHLSYTIGTADFSFEGYGNPQGGGGANLVSFPFVFGTTGGVSVAEDVATFWLLAITLLLIAAAKTVSARTIHAADLGS